MHYETGFELIAGGEFFTRVIRSYFEWIIKTGHSSTIYVKNNSQHSTATEAQSI